MKCLFVGITFFACNYVIWGQDFVFPNNEEMSHVSGGNSTVITERIPVSTPDKCPKDMLLYPGDGVKSAWVCDCRSRFVYFPMNDSCYEVYRQGPCPVNQFVVLPEDDAVPRCEANPCIIDGVVPFNGTCHLLQSTGGPCGPDAALGVNETNFQLECIPKEVVHFSIINTPRRTCPPGSRRSTLGECKKVG
ncbi:PREDICTED: uncharacterized protein LOC106743412 [Dinoponera quadriceps]|uniref:Uncharacterized protein LOC106743412 n=1 Tax=Dinoponera quadriceps TaxID=609295 RepID=A0A6P3X352_DINQU|nr:PREDICTED: uncharacterized protein LOC106743412 [Dinoponera quadriceps]